eukprot:388048-Amphidinium_carterae.1
MLKETALEQALATIAGRRPSHYAGATNVDIKTMLKWLRRQKPWDQSMAIRVWGGGLYWRNRRKT